MSKPTHDSHDSLMGPGCAAYASQLPLLAHGLLDPAERAALAGHLDSCVYCQARLAAYGQIDTILTQVARQARALAPAPDEIVAAVLSQDDTLPFTLPLKTFIGTTEDSMSNTNHAHDAPDFPESSQKNP